MKKYKESLVYFKKLPKEPQYLYNMCFTYLALQKFKIGFKLYENRLLSNNIHPQTGEKERIDVPQLQNWNGIDDCKRLLVIYEQGIGDNIQYYRFIIELSLKYPNMKITYFCKNVVSSILMPYNNIVVNSRCIDTPNFDYKVFIMSLPSILKVESISPNIYNYILQDTAKINYWNEKMRPLKKYKIGFLHKGLLASFIEKNVSIKEFEKLTKLGLDIEIICICKLKELGDEIKSVKNITFFDIDNDSPFTDTVAILQNIDLLITIDSALVHIAGIMGIKTWLLIGYGSDWRWGNTNQTYWYKSVEILRISTNIHLNNIMKDVQKRLIDFVAAKNAETIIYI
jgi:ADP-heptose:LPS heptosyltransferase